MKNNIASLIKKRHNLIPGAAHTYSKGDDQFPANAPKAILRGKGAYVWGSDGKKYLDWCMGLRSVMLGHCYPKINKAVLEQVKEGTNFGRPHISEYQLADLLIKILPNVDMVKFTKNGSTATTAAVKLARAYTGRKYVAVCKDHPFFSYDDWFIGTTACNSGIPEEITNLTLLFNYNDIKSLEKIFDDHPNQIACIIMEAATTVEHKDNFLQKVQALCKKNGAVFIIDEMITGFRWGLGGAQAYFKLKPDLVTYGKGIANGYSLSLLGGRKEIMELGGIFHKKPRVFLISTTHGAETISLAAAMASIKEMKEKKVPQYIWKTGVQLRAGLQKLIHKNGLENNLKIIGFPPNLSMDFRDLDGISSLVLRTIFLQELIKKNILFQGYFPVSYSHRNKELKKTFVAFGGVMKIYHKILHSGNDHSQYLSGPAIKPVFRKYN